MSIGWDPANEIEFEERRTVGCFACHHSKYGVNEFSTLKNKRSYCYLIEAGLLKADYPNEDNSSECFVKKKRYKAP